MYTPGFVISSWKFDLRTESKPPLMAPLARAVEHRRARTRARVMSVRLSSASYALRSTSDAPGAGSTRPGRPIGTELIRLLLRNRGLLAGL